MRRWNGWGDDTIPYHLPANAPVFLDEWVGRSAPPRDATLAEVLADVPPGWRDDELIETLVISRNILGGDLRFYYPDASGHVHRSIQAIKSKGCKAGLVFNPAEPLDVLDWVIDDIDLILIMSVNPGFGGQSFIDSALRKIEAVRKRIDASAKDIRLEVDGGIKVDNIRRVADAGADTFVAGSAIFGRPDYKAVVDAMRVALQP